MRGLRRHGPRGSDYAFVGVDLEEIGGESQAMAIDLFAAFPGRLLAIFRIDVDGPDKAFLPERAIRLHHAMKTTNPHLRALQFASSLAHSSIAPRSRPETRASRSSALASCGRNLG